MIWLARIMFALVLGVWFSAFLHSKSIGYLLLLAVFVVGWSWFGLWLIRELEEE